MARVSSTFSLDMTKDIADLTSSRSVFTNITDSPFQGLDSWGKEYRSANKTGGIDNQILSINGEFRFSEGKVISGTVKDWIYQSGPIYTPPGQNNGFSGYSTVGFTDIYKDFSAFLVADKVSKDIFKWALTGDDYITTSMIYGFQTTFPTNDTIYAYEGNDVVSAGLGIDFIDGGSGKDTAVYAGKISEYTINKSEGLTSVGDLISNRDGLDTLVNIERLQFADYTLDISKNSLSDKTVYLLYKAAFGRMPDSSGFDYWASQAEANGYTATKLAALFSQSDEFKAVFGENANNVQYVGKLYQNILGRVPDLTGEAFWVEQLNKGTSRDDILASFASSPENIKATESFTKDGYWLL